MKRIVIYVSDHGFGHASRVIGLVRQLNQKNYEIIIKNFNAFNFLQLHLPYTKIIKLKTDVGPISNIFLNSPNYEKTFSLYNNWINDQKKWLNKEIEFYKNKKVDLIISDISPISIQLANILGIPSVTIANFTWIDILENFPYHKFYDKIIDWLYTSFEMTDLAIKLPLHMKLKGLKKTKNSSLLYRKTSMSKNTILKKLKIIDRPIVVYLGNNTKKINFILNNKDTKIININQKYLEFDNIKIKSSIEIQNIISASKLVIAKPGYSIFSECINSRCPILTIPRKNYPEDEILVKYGMKFGISNTVNLDKTHTIDLTKFISETLPVNINEYEIQKIENLPSTSNLISELLLK
tara:strand:- start:52 stop:1107 length:1056 start_codon:yes stop_codon:yes gene_type:complete